MLTAFKDRLKEKKGCSGTETPPVDVRVGSSSKNPKKRAREGDNIA